ncbi:GTP-binding protein [Microcoleus sp. LEGE 07076]|uniref:GTP-binding protein n=1 Tax=Microcoleus sp. LEGE 07076 TaxID=915322 RepID=UPI00187F463B|nr:GTP-binding protein [Microcoleus sp. LEGE 07076]MBE9183658.1 GTP-binding protein [Microcoleus sp. LEGE 07076]
MADNSIQENRLSLARASLREALARYSHLRQGKKNSNNTELEAALQTQLDILSYTSEKLEGHVIRIATFGMVSRGKSAVLNALLGEKILQTGPLNGVTKWPRSVRWTIPALQAAEATEKIQVELIDTPGIDEVGGEVRGDMAKQVTRQADLILFVVAGDITRTEYQALCELQTAQKPLILVFNKIDLYPELDRKAIYQSLQALGNYEQLAADSATDATDSENSDDRPNNSADKSTPKSAPKTAKSLEIVMVAAEPAPVQVRVEWSDGRVTNEWESPPAQIDQLKHKILTILNREGRSLLALNALVEARDAESNIARQVLKLRQAEADDLIWQFAKYKALAVGLNPVAFLDVMGATVADLALIRSLSRLYGLPMTGYEAGKLWQTIFSSAGGVLLGELGSSFLLGFGKSAAAAAPQIGFSTFAGVAVTQASLAAYGTYAVGRAAQVYLEKGCTWGPLGQDTVIQEILATIERNTIIDRLQQEFKI